ncbi:YceI family protein [Tenacibaculum sp. UWU-22]|uniref:YceI family protein n=1 Tax=Tenacibaculum sp. UWU-22 TaxID=3234187 RepID=UPI0034DB0405
MKKTITILILLLATNILFSQKTVSKKELTITFPSKVLIKGTSTLHNWESTVEKPSVTMVLNDVDDTKNIESLNVSITSTNIKSGKRLMDKLTYEALKSDEYPHITFVFKKGKLIKENNSEVDIELNGNLTIAGVTKNVSVPTNINKKGTNIYLKGVYKLKMTDYGVTPPKALFGTIKTGDEITIDFNLKLN